MKNFIILEYAINLIILLFFHMHMFQLNSYFIKKHLRWIKSNYKKIALQTILVLLPLILASFNNLLLNWLSIFILGFSIFYNYPKTKTKIPFKITHRVKRVLLTELILFFLILIIHANNYILFKLCIMNIFSIFICMIANIINAPIECLIKKNYIKQAKQLIQSMPNLVVIGVTGSYGKTSVKNFLVKALSAKYEVLTTPKNYNTTMGVVKTIREHLTPLHQIFICEMGATNIGDIKEICDIVKPKIGIITSIGPQHLESFKNIENIVKTKFELLDSVKEVGGTMFLNYNNEYIKSAVKSKTDMQIISYGIEDKNLNYNAYNITSSSNGLNFKVLNNSNKEIDFKTKIIGKHNVINLTGAIAVANYLGVPLEKMVHCIRELKSVEHRLELISRNNLTIIDDSYNSNPISSKSALETLSDFEGTKIIVTPGLIELGSDEEKYNFEFGRNITAVCDYIILVGNTHSKLVLSGIFSTNFDKEKVFIVNTPDDAFKKISGLNIAGNINVLLENDLPDNYNL